MPAMWVPVGLGNLGHIIRDLQLKGPLRGPPYFIDNEAEAQRG